MTARLRQLARRPAICTALVAVVLAIVYVGTVSTAHAINDVDSADVAAWRIAASGAPWLDGVDTLDLPLDDPENLWIVDVPSGHRVIARSPGVMLAPVPAYWLAGASDDPASFSLLPGALTGALLTAAAMVMFYLALAGLVSRAAQLLSTAVLAFATPMWTVAADGMYTHSITAFGLAGFAWSVRRERWWLAGLFGAASLWGRLHVVLIIAAAGLLLALVRRRPGIAVRIGIPGVVSAALASWWTHSIYGSWMPSGGYRAPNYIEGAAARTLRDQAVNLAGTFVSPDRGLLVWSPVLLLLVPAVWRGWRSAPDWTRILAVSGVVYLLVQWQMNVFHGGSGFASYRLALEPVLCAAPLFAVTARHIGPVARALMGPVLGLQWGMITIASIAEGFFLPLDRMWHDNSDLHGLRTMPGLSSVLVLTIVTGVLAALVWRERSLRWSPATGLSPGNLAS